MVWSAIGNIGKTLLKGAQAGKNVAFAAGGAGRTALANKEGIRAALEAVRTGGAAAYKALPAEAKSALIRTGYAGGGLAVGKGLFGGGNNNVPQQQYYG